MQRCQAVDLTRTICSNVTRAGKAAGVPRVTVVLRGDSTLRGHYPQVGEGRGDGGGGEWACHHGIALNRRHARKRPQKDTNNVVDCR